MQMNSSDTKNTLQWLATAASLLVATRNLIPVDYVPPGIGTKAVLYQIVGMLPDIVAHHRIQTIHERLSGLR